MTKRYKTPLKERLRSAARYRAIKAAGGEAYAEMLERQRAAVKAWKLANPEKNKENHRKHKKKAGATPHGLKSRLVHAARARGRKKGLDGTIQAGDIYWPTHCPVLGIELDYNTPMGSRKPGPNSPTLDRWDNSKGYVVGNVYVISMRANTIKNNATADELLAVAKYAAHGPTGALPE